jgi:hypothetical protein
MATTHTTEEDQREALRRCLSGLAEGADVFELAESVTDLHPKNNTFPGEVFMGLAADAMEITGVTRADPVQYDGLREAYLPEAQFRGRENRKIQYALLTSASVRAGLEPDLLDEVTWWHADDYWRYALYAAVALIRAGADRQAMPIAELLEQLAEHHDIALT